MRIPPFDIVSDTLGIGEVFAVGNYMHGNVTTDGKVVTDLKSIAI